MIRSLFTVVAVVVIQSRFYFSSAYQSSASSSAFVNRIHNQYREKIFQNNNHVAVKAHQQQQQFRNTKKNHLDKSRLYISSIIRDDSSETSDDKLDNNNNNNNNNIVSLYTTLSSVPDTTTNIKQLEQIQTTTTTPSEADVVVDVIDDTDGSPGNSAMLSLLSKIYEKIGTIDETRYVIPEYTTGEMPRVFSSIEYEKDINTGIIISAKHSSGSIISAMSLIAGTTIGAGVLALPTATVSAGFLPSTLAMFIAYGYMVVSGLLIAELQVNRMGNTGKPYGNGLLDLYHKSLGGTIGFIGTIAYFFLHYSTMVAYIAQGGNNISTMISGLDINTLATLPQGTGQIAFASICGIALYNAKNSKMIEMANNILVTGVIGTFIAIVTLALPTTDFSALLDMSNQHPEEIVNCFPILFLSFVYQNIIPTIVTQLEGDRMKIIYSVVGGTAIPLIMFIIWNAVILGNVFGSGIIDIGMIDPIAMLQNGPLGSTTILGPLVTIFSICAITTSVIGFTYGLIEAWTDTFQQYNNKNNNKQSNNDKQPLLSSVTANNDAFTTDVKVNNDSPRSSEWNIVSTITTNNNNPIGDNAIIGEGDSLKPLLYSLVFVPPLLFSIINPNVFYNALEYGGAFGVSTLFLILPPIMIWKQRYGDHNEPLYTKPLVPLGKIPLGSMWKAAGTLILEQGAEKLGIFNFIQDKLNL